MLRAGQLDAEAADRALAVIERNAQAADPDDRRPARRVADHHGQDATRRPPVDPKGVVEAAIDAIRPAADAKDIRLQSVLDPLAGPSPATRPTPADRLEPAG